MYIPDPIEILENAAERLYDEKYVDEYTCMECGKRCDYQLMPSDPMGYGPLLCEECLGHSYEYKDDKDDGK